jgi:N-acetylglucosamine-6-phosphate deacetylase
MLFRDAKVILPHEVIEGCSVRTRDDRIVEVGSGLRGADGEETVDARGYFLAPGFIELHMHVGYLRPDLPLRHELDLCAENLPANGTTRFLPTLISALRGDLPEHFQAIRCFLADKPPGAKPLGVHLEGPYIASEARGGFLPTQIATPAEFSLRPILDSGADLIRVVSLSPELPGVVEVIRDCVQRGVVVGMCHTHAGIEAYQAARRAGATYIAHTYNNRRTFPDSPLGGRAFNLDDLGVADDAVSCELICDGTHVQPVWIKTIYRTKGPAKINLVTDSFMAGRRSAEGEVFQTLGGQKLTVRNGVGRDENGALSGSVLTQDRAVRVFMQHSRASLAEAVRCASLNPACVLAADDRLGSIVVGKLADLVLLDEELHPMMTLVDGKVVFRQAAKMTVPKCSLGSREVFQH